MLIAPAGPAASRISPMVPRSSASGYATDPRSTSTDSQTGESCQSLGVVPAAASSRGLAPLATLTMAADASKVRHR
jgi:hypothetical protein